MIGLPPSLTTTGKVTAIYDELVEDVTAVGPEVGVEGIPAIITERWSELKVDPIVLVASSLNLTVKPSKDESIVKVYSNK